MIWGFYSGCYEVFYLPGYVTTLPVEIQQKFQKNDSPPCSVYKNKPSKKSALSRWQAEPEDGVNTFLRNVGWLSMGYIALYPRR
jgi:hypothetical protein